ncbi:hypothetical protein [Reinekea sp.]|uniref:hypothetical protein n=1 Tax=Reinekea sp. TaxID=1970455 RepID=UPI002A805A32|nr:hypothetical protein [Reinekea sp.]
MANDGIRLPSDSTVASQTIVRGGGQPESTALPAKNAPAAPVSPLLTIVLQSNALIEGKKAALYELILQNDPKSAPPLSVLSDTPIKPGTSLLLELDKNQQYQPVQQPTLTQLTKLVNLELDFWRGHLLPKAAARYFPILPSPTALTGLADRFSALTPLINWLNQRPSGLSSPIVNAWMRETVALTHLRPWATPTIANAADLATSPGLTTRPLTSPSLQLPTQSWQLLNMPRLDQVGPVNAALVSTQPSLAGASGNSVSQTLAAGMTPTPGSPLTASPISQSPTANTIQANAVPAALATLGSALPGANTTGQTQNPLAVAPLASPAAGAWPGGGPAAPATGNGPASNPVALPQTAAPALNPSSSVTNPSNPAGPGVQLGTPTANVTPNTEPGILTATQGLAIPIGQHSNLSSPVTASTVTASTASSNSASSSERQAVPLEIKLGQWLGVLDETIKASPIQLNARLKQQASELLQQSLLQPGKIRAQQEPGQNKTQDKDDSPLLALRNWLEASQARIQNSAIQTASAQWSAPDQPTVQQMQLPLIWLGLTSWADIEWWQEKQLSTGNADKDARARRRWRMKVYLSLAPMADVCADIDWGTDFTSLTFWSEDAATLGHLNGLLPKLEGWTAGLGERNLQTKHGMPKKMNADREKEKDNHLVDLHT